MNNYECFYNGKRITVQAAKLADAADIAVKELRVSKKQRGRLAVVLADEPVFPASI